jgi:dolichyl-phosphate-mannose--protein O-mannosyl transferase
MAPVFIIGLVMLIGALIVDLKFKLKLLSALFLYHYLPVALFYAIVIGFCVILLKKKCPEKYLKLFN